MKITKKLQEWLVASAGVSADASESDFEKAAADSLVDGSLTNDKFVELTTDEDAQKANSLEQQLQELMQGVQSGMKQMADRMDAIESARQEAQPVVEEKSYTDVPVAEKAPEMAAGVEKAMASASPQPTGKVDVIGAHKQYDDTKRQATYPTHTDKGFSRANAGRPVYEGDGASGSRAVQEPSELDRAVSGAYLKWTLSSQLGNACPRKLRMTDHDNDLLQFALRERKWCGVVGGEGTEDEGAVGLKGEKLTPRLQKQILDDGGASGGTEAVPIAFDDDVILTPLLHGELFPKVNLVNITRGSNIEGVRLLNVALVAGDEGTDIALQGTASFVNAFDTPIHVVNGAIELGLDMLSDSPVDLAGIITRQYGEQLMAFLDRVICVGDGTNEPDGVLGAAGDTHTGALALEIGDFEGLLFGVSKAYRAGTPTNRIAYASQEALYQRVRGLPVDTSDDRRLFGMDHESYSILGHPYAINEEFADAVTCIFGNFARYRMYRRLGLTVRATTEGRSLARSNLMLITARARFGGQVEDGAAFSETTTLN